MDKVCLELVDVEISFLDRLILDIPRLAVHQFDRIGIVGMNGAGKSTLLKLMAGLISPDKGKVHRFADFACFDQLTPPDNDEADYELTAKLAVPNTDLDCLSGGEQTRLKLAQLFSTFHEGLLLDEPTTHLDVRGTQFFIDELACYYGALVLVSHDRRVLDELVAKIWEVEDGRVIEYTGNYSDYVTQKELQLQRQLELHEEYVQEKNRLLSAAEDKMKKAKKITRGIKGKTEAPSRLSKTKSKGTVQKAMQRGAKALEQRVEQMETIDAPEREGTIYFHQGQTLVLHNKFPIIGEDVTLRAGDKVLLRNANFQFPLGSTLAITGNNGAGKTTLLRHILKQGEGITMSPKAVIGDYAQMGYHFTESKSVLAYMEACSDYKESKIRSVLHAMNFRGNDLRKDVRDLSGGEAVRLALCQLFLGRYNVLFLDEPTTFLDVFCIQALEQFIKWYEGTAVLVSHDQVFLDNVSDCIYVIEDQQLKLARS